MDAPFGQAPLAVELEDLVVGLQDAKGDGHRRHARRCPCVPRERRINDACADTRQQLHGNAPVLRWHEPAALTVSPSRHLIE